MYMYGSEWPDALLVVLDADFMLVVFGVED